MNNASNVSSAWRREMPSRRQGLQSSLQWIHSDKLRNVFIIYSMLCVSVLLSCHVYGITRDRVHF